MVDDLGDPDKTGALAMATERFGVKPPFALRHPGASS